MIDFLAYLNVPAKIGLIIIAAFLVMQIVGELLEFKGKVVPEAMKIRKLFSRRKQEREMIHEVLRILPEVQQSIKEFNAHYSADNISKRDCWIEKVNTTLESNDKWMKELALKLDKNNEDTLSLLIDNKRNTIINFASYVIEEKNPVTREQFNRVFKLYEEYEEIIRANKLTNGEVEVAIRIIREAYEKHMRDRTFIEDIRGY